MRWEAAAQVLGRHMERGKAARGRPVRGTWPARAAAVGRRENREPRAGGRRRGICRCLIGCPPRDIPKVVSFG
jgi:hypothetical protein